MNGWTGRTLRINLDTNETNIEEIDPLILQRFLGGRGLGAYFLYQETTADVDPLGPDNVLAFCTGPLTGANVPTSGRSSLSTRSPLTRTLFDSNSGCQFGVRLKWAGFDALIIRGAAPTPVWIEVTADGAKIHPADQYWGMDVPSTLQHFQEKETAAVCIGPAGEQLVRIASIMDDEGHAYGRGGVAAVMGSKKIKAISATGIAHPDVFDKESLDFINYESRKWLHAVPRTSQGLPEFGTPVLVNLMNLYGVLPTQNFQKGCFEAAEKISGERLREDHLVKRGACWGCPISCKRKTHTAQEHGEGPEYETIFALGSDLCIDNFEALIEANYLCNRLGLDTISVGGTLACAMELAENGFLETDLRFGRADLLKSAIESIAYRKGIGNLLAEGSKRLAKECGHPEMAMQVKGLELAGYDPRGMQGQGLLYATSNRGACHLRGNMLGPELLGAPKMLDRHASRGKAGILIVIQHTSAVIDSIGLCKFVNFAINDEFFARMLTYVTGVHYEVQDILFAGERIWNLERLYNLRAGFDRIDDNLPDRFINTPLAEGGSKGHVVELDGMLEEYYRFRGWSHDGVPSAKKLEALGISELAAQLQKE